MKGAIYGLAVGDALGVPYEFRQRDTFKCEKMVGYGTHHKPAGTWSDDTSMTLATCDSIKKRGIDYDDLMSRFAGWLYNAKYTAYEETFGVGGTTQKAIGRYRRGATPLECGIDNVRANGNGALMRILPLAFTDCTEDEIINVCGLTHAHWQSKYICLVYVMTARRLIKGEGLSSVLKHFQSVTQRPRENVKSTGYVVDTFEAAIWCLANTSSYKDCVLAAVNLGDDTDTVAAVAGGLAGIVYGYDAIPKEWIDALANKELIDSCIWEVGE